MPNSISKPHQEHFPASGKGMMILCWFLGCFMSHITRLCASLLCISSRLKKLISRALLSLHVKAHDSSLVTMFICIAHTFPELHEALFCTRASLPVRLHLISFELRLRFRFQPSRLASAIFTIAAAHLSSTVELFRPRRGFPDGSEGPDGSAGHVRYRNLLQDAR